MTQLDYNQSTASMTIILACDGRSGGIDGGSGTIDRSRKGDNGGRADLLRGGGESW